MCGEADPGIVDQDINAPVLLPQVLPQPGDGSLVRDVRRVVASPATASLPRAPSLQSRLIALSEREEYGRL